MKDLDKQVAEATEICKEKFDDEHQPTVKSVEIRQSSLDEEIQVLQQATARQDPSIQPR